MKTIEEITDYKEAAQVLADEFAALNWNGTTVTGGHLATDADNWKHYAWVINFAPPGKPIVSLTYKCGTGHVHGKTANFAIRGKPIPPNPAEVLACYCRGYADSDCAFDEWTDTFGYDTDSRKALAVYDECRAAGPKLRALGLTRAQIARFAELSSML